MTGLAYFLLGAATGAPLWLLSGRRKARLSAAPQADTRRGHAYRRVGAL